MTEVRPRLIALTAAAATVAALLPIPLEPRAHSTLVILIVAAGLWMTEAVPVALPALLIPVLAVGLGVATPKAAFAGFGDPILFLFFGTFLLTQAADDHGLNRRLARAVLGSRLVQANPKHLLWAVAALGVFISAWVNNTATTALILPLALTAEARLPRRALVLVLLMASYGPSIGGLATPVGTAPNLIGLRLIEEATGHHVGFADFCARFTPLTLLMAVVMIAYALFLTRGESATRGAAAVGEASGPWSRAEKTLVALFAVVVALWIVPGILQATALGEAAWLKAWATHLPETVVPITGAVLLFVLPARDGPILQAEVLRRIDWSTLLLFGGGLSLGSLMFETGLARELGEGIYAAIPWRGTFGVVLAATVMAVAVSEVTSNTASASLVVPVVLALAKTAGVDPMAPALAATAACSFGFMLPVSTPPNALVYAAGHLRIIEMVRYGILLDLAGIALITVWFTWVAH